MLPATLQKRESHFPGDRHRPGYHFLPAKNWMNDPNGLIQWQGRYHLFYQYNPNSPLHGTIHWGHAVSDDLVYWEDLPLALTPTPGGSDAEGCWSGCMVDHDGVPTMIYTGVFPQVVCLATSADDMATWEKFGDNPVIAAPPEELGARTGGHFRDPFVWREGGRWHMVIGTKIERVGGLILHYVSDDLVHWDYLGPLLQGDSTRRQPLSTGTMWECPNIFKLGEQHLLFFSVQSESDALLYPVYYMGDFDGSQFTPKTQSIMVYGGSMYAPQAMRAQDGRVIMWGWLMEGRTKAAFKEAGWSGVMSLPMTLAATPDRGLDIEPVEEIKRLRGEHSHWETRDIQQGSSDLLHLIQGDCLEIDAVFEPGTATEFGITLLCSPDGAEQTRLVYDSAQGRLIYDPSRSSVSTSVHREIQEAPLSLDAHGALRLHIFLDRSTLEVFANQSLCLAGRIYPTRSDSLNLGLFANIGDVKLKSLDIWRMGSIW